MTRRAFLAALLAAAVAPVVQADPTIAGPYCPVGFD